MLAVQMRTHQRQLQRARRLHESGLTIGGLPRSSCRRNEMTMLVLILLFGCLGNTCKPVNLAAINVTVNL